jgi:hypothetical protein
MVGGLEQRRAMPAPAAGTTRRRSNPFQLRLSHPRIVPASSQIECEVCAAFVDGGKAESELQAVGRTESGLRMVVRTAPDPRRVARCLQTKSKSLTEPAAVSRSCRRWRVPGQTMRP